MSDGILYLASIKISWPMYLTDRTINTNFARLQQITATGDYIHISHIIVHKFHIWEKFIQLCRGPIICSDICWTRGDKDEESRVLVLKGLFLNLHRFFVCIWVWYLYLDRWGRTMVSEYYIKLAFNVLGILITRHSVPFVYTLRWWAVVYNFSTSVIAERPSLPLLRFSSYSCCMSL